MAVYTGSGVLNFKDEDYKYGDTLPDGVDIDALKASGKAADRLPTSPVVASLIEVQAEHIKKLTIDATDLAVRLNEADNIINDLTAKLAAAEKAVADLTAQLMTPPAAPAGPKK